MQLGDIFLWNTDQAAGHASRNKYHVYICEGDWRAGHTFLFISKADYGCDYPILKSDYDFFPLEKSFVNRAASIDLPAVQRAQKRDFETSGPVAHAGAVAADLNGSLMVHRTPS
jgi:hypothetical protein